MKLSEPEKADLLRGVLAAFPQRMKFAQVLGLPPVSRRMDTVTAETQTTDAQYFEVIQRANDEGWIDLLLQGLLAVDRVNPALVALIHGFQGLREPTPARPPHLELVLDGAPFVNHRPLREALFAMTQDGGPKILQVTGQRTSGKSYSQYLIAHIGRAFGAEIYLAPPLEATTTAVELAEDIALNLDLGPLPGLTDDPGDAQTVRRLVRWIVAMGRKLDRDWWLIFDGFETATVQDSVLMLLAGLAQSVGSGQPERMKLHLLAWDRAISGPPPGRVFEQVLTPFDRAHVKGFLEDLVAAYAMPEGIGSVDELMGLCYQDADAARDAMDQAVTLTRRLQKVCEAARQASRGGQP